MTVPDDLLRMGEFETEAAEARAKAKAEEVAKVRRSLEKVISSLRTDLIGT